MKFEIIPAETLFALVDLCNQHELNELSVKTGEGKFRVSKVAQGAIIRAPVVPADHSGIQRFDGYQMVSPLNGVFYRASSPDAKPLAEEGDTVLAGDPLCIIEAMKVMNEITSDVHGIVHKILPKDGDVVDKGTILFLIKPEEIHGNA